MLPLFRICTVALCFAQHLAAADQAVNGPAANGLSPYWDTELAPLMEAVTFHVSFDNKTVMPDMAEGAQYEPTFLGTSDRSFDRPQFAPGLIGQALVLGSGSTVYPRAGNVLLDKRGAIALWIKPEDWQRPQDGNCVFVMTSNSTFYLERQGPARDEDGRVTRHEGILYLASLPGKRSTTINGGSDWENGRWYLLVANWSWPTMELSVNGEPFKVRSLPAVPEDGDFGSLVLGDRRGVARGLLDEFMAFRRPLSHGEVQLLYQLGNRQDGN
jgi:hypothetical protein